jgi:small redox-active disulfide protein 2
MRIILVLGPGCQKCQILYERAKQAAEDIGLDYEIDKVSNIQMITNFGVMTTPALVVDGTVKVSGHVPTVAQLKELLA